MGQTLSEILGKMEQVSAWSYVACHWKDMGAYKYVAEVLQNELSEWISRGSKDYIWWVYKAVRFELPSYIQKGDSKSKGVYLSSG